MSNPIKIEIESTDKKFLARLWDFLSSDKYKVEKDSTTIRFVDERSQEEIEAESKKLMDDMERIANTYPQYDEPCSYCGAIDCVCYIYDDEPCDCPTCRL